MTLPESLGEGPILKEVERICASPQFVKSKQLRALLRFLVERALQGRENELKEYNIGLDVFGRGGSFDPAADNIVRVEARRLRVKLDEYYEHFGWLDLVRIGIPKGAYVPQFSLAAKQVANPHRRMVSSFRIKELLAETPDGLLFRALDADINLEVTLWLSGEIENPAVRRSVMAAGRQAAGLVRAHILPIREIGEFSERVFMVFPPVSGTLLSAHIENGLLPLEQALPIMISLSKTVEDLHSAGLVSGSLRPHDIVLESSEGTLRPVLMLTAANLRTTPDDTSRSPEQREGKWPDVRSDIWALGAMLERMSRQGTVNESADQALPDRSPAIGPVSQIVERCLTEDPTVRYQTARELAEALEGLGQQAAPQPAQQASEFPAPPGTIAPLRGFVLLWSWLTGNRSMRPFPSSATDPIPLAVLPFTNLSGDPQWDPVSEGLGELLTGNLAAFPLVRVVSAHTLWELKNSSLPISDIGKTAGVRYILEGTFSIEGEHVQITAKLTQTTDLTSVWSQNYSGHWDRVLAVDRKIAADVAKAIGLASGPSGSSAKVARRQNGTSEAFDTWLRGHEALLDYANNKDAKSWQEPDRLLSWALELDPVNVEAMVDQGYLHWVAAFPPAPDQHTHLARAEQSLRRAIALSPEHSRALSFLGILLFFANQRSAGIEMIERAISKQSKDGDPHFQLSNVFCGMGFWEAALVELDQTIKTSPPMNQSFRAKAGLLSLLGRHSEAISTLEELPVNSLARKSSLGYTLFRAGRDDEAKKVLLDAEGEKTGPGAGQCGLVLAAISAKRGDLSAAARAFAQTQHGIRADDQLLILDAIAGRDDRLTADLLRHPLHNNYRWIAGEPRLRRFENNPGFRAVVDHLFQRWVKDVEKLGPRLPARAPRLPTPDEYFRIGASSELYCK